MLKRGLILGGVLGIISSISVCNVFADETASSTFSIDVSDVALQVTVPVTASIELNPTNSSAVFGSTNITVNVATNNPTGYNISMSVPTTDLTHSTITGNNAPVIPTLQSATPQSTFPANAWGYKTTGENYNPVQLTNTDPSWQAEDPTNGTDHIITLAVKVDGMKQAGTYKSTLTFDAVANLVIPERINTEEVGYFYNLGGPYSPGLCTQWAWYNRQDLPRNLGNANTWATHAASMGYSVDRNPSPGDIFQTNSGWYGHVGYVESVNPDGSIVVTEMNYNSRQYLVTRSTIPAYYVENYLYIHH